MKSISSLSLKSGSRLGLVVVAAVVALIAVCGVCSADGLQTGSVSSSASSTILIKIDINQSSITDIVDSANIIYDYSSLMPGCYAIKTPAGYTRDEAIAYYSSLPYVIYAEPDSQVSAVDSGSSAPTTSSQSPFPFAGVLAGLGVAVGALRIARKL